MSTVGKPRVAARTADSRETYQERQLRAERQAKRDLHRRVIRYVAGRARDADDARQLLDALDLDPVDGRP